MSSVELFAGAGGLAMGVTRAGFKHSAVVEWDKFACQTIRENLKYYKKRNTPFKLIEGDARLFDIRNLGSEVEIITGGPPCQPFSLGGKHRGNDDHRDMFPIAVREVARGRPKAFIFENVKGLLRRGFSTYFEYVYLQLSYPSMSRKSGESWQDHLSRLEKTHTAGKKKPEYNVVYRLLNAADYGVPQRRERVFIVGFRSDLSVSWSFPDPTHSEKALFLSKWATGDYWEEHRVPKKLRPKISDREKARLRKIDDDLMDVGHRWRTVRDALRGLPDPTTEASDDPFHAFIPGARVYTGHTGSPYDDPAKTLKAGDHGVPGGENMIVLDNGKVRYFTIREAARLQTFPDDYVFHGAWGQIMRQLGNAVPVELAEVMAKSVAKSLGK